MALSKFTTNQYADKSVTGAKIADKTITGANLADNIVLPGSLKVNDGTTDLLSILTGGATLNTSLHVNGNITFTGSIDSTVVTEQTLEITDAQIKLRAGQTLAPTTTDHAYLYVERGTLNDTYIQWDENTDKWKLSNDGTNAYRIVTDVFNADMAFDSGSTTALYIKFATGTTANQADHGGLSWYESGLASAYNARLYYDGSTVDGNDGRLTFAGTSAEGTVWSIGRAGLMYVKDDIKLGATGDINFNSKYYIGPNIQTAPTYAASKSLKFYTEGDYAFYSATSTAATFSLYNETNAQRMYMQAAVNDVKFTLSAVGSFSFYNNGTTSLANIESDGDVWAAKDVSATANLLAGGVVKTNGTASPNTMAGYLVIGGTAMSSTERLYVVGDAKATNFIGDLYKTSAVAINTTNATGSIVDFKSSNTTKSSITVGGNFTGASYSVYALDDRDVKPADTPKGYIKPYFASLEGLTGTAGTDYQDLLVLNTYTDTSCGNVNALAFDKSEMKIRHYQAAQGATTWGTPKTLAYDDHTHDFVSSVGLKATKVTFAAGETTKTFTHNFGVAQYAVTVCSSSPMRHVYYSNKTNNTVDINIDDVPYGSAIDVDVIVFKY